MLTFVWERAEATSVASQTANREVSLKAEARKLFRIHKNESAFDYKRSLHSVH